jgi:A/G-specific adenine glycosylase
MTTTHAFADALLHWFDQHGRSQLPWQHNRTPYRVWVSEIMLQQTQVMTAIPFYERFMAAMPTVRDLAAAPEDAVLHLWTGLGYYARARNLHRSAKLICADYGGRLPGNLDDLISLPGIGRSTAGAILCLAMGGRAPILDGNVKRVLARHYAIEGWPGQRAVSDQLWTLAEHNTPHERVADYTQAIMDLGATCCKRTQPSCATCPVQTNCRALATQSQTAFPGRKLQKPKPSRQRWFAVAVRSSGEVLLQKRAAEGIWGGLWAPPEFSDEASAKEFLHDTVGVSAGNCYLGTPFHHVFTHFKLEATPVYAQCSENQLVSPAVNIDEENVRWFSLHPVPSVGLPAPIVRLLKTLGNNA